MPVQADRGPNRGVERTEQAQRQSRRSGPARQAETVVEGIQVADADTGSAAATRDPGGNGLVVGQHEVEAGRIEAAHVAQETGHAQLPKGLEHPHAAAGGLAGKPLEQGVAGPDLRVGERRRRSPGEQAVNLVPSVSQAGNHRRRPHQVAVACALNSVQNPHTGPVDGPVPDQSTRSEGSTRRVAVASEGRC